jgi:hypothetical protein
MAKLRWVNCSRLALTASLTSRTWALRAITTMWRVVRAQTCIHALEKTKLALQSSSYIMKVSPILVFILYH